MEKLQLLIKLKITANVIDSHIASILDHDLLNKGFLEKAKIANACQSTRKNQGKNWKTEDLFQFLPLPLKFTKALFIKRFYP